MGRVARLLGREVHQKLVDVLDSVDCLTAHVERVSLSSSHMPFRTFQESDAEKSDQDLVVDVANEVRDYH